MSDRRPPRTARRAALSALVPAALIVALVAQPGAASGGAPAGDVASRAAQPAPAERPTNVALAGTATASSVELDRPDFVAAHVNDGDPSTRWSSKYVDDGWVQVELAEPTPVDHVVLDWPNACARDFTLQTSTDGVTWTDVESVQRDTCPRTDVVEVGTSDPVSFVRMQGASRWSSWGYSIAELEVWDGPQPPPEPGLGLVPRPVSVVEHDAEPFTLRDGARILAVGDGAVAPARDLADVLRPSTGLALPIAPVAPSAVPDAPRGDSPAPVVIDVRPGNVPAGQAAEGYTLDVGAAQARVAADTPQGALHGVRTLRQLFPQWVEADEVVHEEWTVPAVSISDHPRFEHRGVMLDVARSFYPVAEVKQYIDAAAQFKMNRLHLHLTDDQGWRIAVDQPEHDVAGIDFGRLTEVGGATAMTERGTEPGVAGSYSKADYAEIVRYAGTQGMVVIPEVDMPGHVNSALHSIPQLNTEGALPRPQPGEATVPHNGTGAVGYSSFDADSAATYAFVEHVLTEIASMTPGPYLHIGGDEAHSTSHEQYTTMVDAFTRDVAALGKTVVGWNEYAGTDLPQDGAVVQFWNGDRQEVADAVTDRGAQVVLSPVPHTYLPQKQDARQPQGATWACGGPCGLGRHYGWDPGTYIPGIAETSVLGVESALWGEFIRRIDQAEYYGFPRIMATAEVGWTPQAQRDYGDFTSRLAEVGGRLTLQGTNFFPTADVDWQAAVLGEPVRAEVGAPARARWSVTLPGASTDDVTALVTWSDGVTQRVPVTTSREASIPAMQINDPFAAVSERTFDEPGRYTATLSVSVPGGAPVDDTVTVDVRR